ncbi:hypothetical protein HYH03_012456 [Edaphochlamys debaryana]|uniref:CNNM transmembrane domain-containing protein n=1 Tax=Edaphochlamys debaryana TaxID=47281 RepID=A0A835XRQ7_9CHLO|nr:hypothetical protein HYH03_012456 [Edaphochlamys debaryana]|eukprot:KAG2489018.1 hypothetical protein HYH03_012456 [Edaphochlamys debaryana]
MGILRMLLGEGGDDGEEELDDFSFTLYISISLFLVCMAGLMSGLTLGLMSLDTVELEVLKRSGTPEERACAVKIMPVIKHQHFLLVTLLLCNAAATEALPLFIDRLANPVAAVLLSVSVVLVFGEIIPQAVCSRYGLKVGAYSAWFVRLLMCLCSPVAWPIGKLLDFLLGPDHTALFRRAQLKALVDLHGSGAGFGGTLSEDEVHVIRGALDLTNKVASKSMTPLDKVFMLSTEDRLDERTLQAILMSGHSRIPVHRESNRKALIGLILVKELVLINPADMLPVSSLRLRELPRLAADTPMYDMLKLFETGKSHMAALTSQPGQGQGGGPGEDGASPGAMGGRKTVGTSWPTHPRGAPFRRLASRGRDLGREGGYVPLGEDAGPGGPGAGPVGPEAEPVGIITIEDVIEELLQEEIIDETDLYIDNMQSQRVNAAAVAGSLPPRLRQVLQTGLFTPRVGRLGAAAAPAPASLSGRAAAAAAAAAAAQELSSTALLGPGTVSSSGYGAGSGLSGMGSGGGSGLGVGVGGSHSPVGGPLGPARSGSVGRGFGAGLGLGPGGAAEAGVGRLGSGSVAILVGSAGSGSGPLDDSSQPLL